MKLSMKLPIYTQNLLWLAPFLRQLKMQKHLLQLPFDLHEHLITEDLKRFQRLIPELKPNMALIDEVSMWLEDRHNHLLTYDDAAFPPQLKELADPPWLLFVRGNLAVLATPQIAVVGSRSPTPGGLKLAEEWVEALTLRGFTITSGFAIGIDGIAHKTALKHGGLTIALMGTGLKVCYPQRHLKLYDEIVAHNGALVSEFGLTEAALPWHFPLRNRLISGLSLGTLVVEAALKSGSLITARLAAELGREVWAIPGSPLNPKAAGCNYLIQQGAKLVSNIEDLLEELPATYRNRYAAKPAKMVKHDNELARDLQTLLDCIGFEVTTVDNMRKSTNWSIETINGALLDLELLGWIRAHEDGYIRLK